MIVELIAGSGDVSSGLVVRRYFDGINQAFLQTGRGNIIPGSAAIAGYLYIAIIATGPYCALFMRRFYYISQRTIVFGTHRFVGKRPAALALLCFFVAGKVGRYFFPATTHIAGFQQLLATMVKSIGFMPAPNDWGIPVVTILHVFCIHAQVLNGCRHYVDRSAGFHIK